MTVTWLAVGNRPWRPSYYLIVPQMGFYDGGYDGQLHAIVFLAEERLCTMNQLVVLNPAQENINMFI